MLENEKLDLTPSPPVEDANVKAGLGSAGFGVVEALAAGNPKLDAAGAEEEFQAVPPNALAVGAAWVDAVVGAAVGGLGLAPNPPKVGWVVVVVSVEAVC